MYQNQSSHSFLGFLKTTPMENSPHFFKIILPDTLRQGKLGIPKKFVRKYGHGLSSPVILKVPSGGTWQVELLKCDGEAWLEKGWPEFADYHSLDYGHFLVFRYDGPRGFYVLIFDKSATEIEYPCRNSCTVVQNPERHFQDQEIEENEDSISVEILDDPSLLSKQGEKAPLPLPSSCKKMGTNNRTEISLCETLPASSSHGIPSSAIMLGNSHCSKMGFEGKLNQLKRKTIASEQAIRPSCAKTSPAREAACNHILNSKFPAFDAEVHADSVQRTFVSIPASFCQVHFQQKINMLTLSVADRLWPVKLIMYPYRSSSKFSAGWSAFARENSLQKGDVCTFELIECRTIKVTVFRCVG